MATFGSPALPGRQSYCAMQFASRPDRSIETFLKTCLSIDLKSLREFLKNTPSANLVEEKIEKTAISIRSVLTNYAKSLRYLQGLDKEGKPEFSIREWMTDAQYDSSWLFISTTARHRKAVRPLISMWLSLATLLLQSMGETPEESVPQDDAAQGEAPELNMQMEKDDGGRLIVRHISPRKTDQEKRDESDARQYSDANARMADDEKNILRHRDDYDAYQEMSDSLDSGGYER